MRFVERLVSLGRWRWSASVGVFAVACLPIGGALVLIPPEITPPWGVRARLPFSRAQAKHAPTSESTTTAETLGSSEAEPKAQMAMLSNPPRAENSPAAQATGSPRSAERPRLTGLRGIFVPRGETDDSTPVEPRRRAQP
jgi:hypothetical protein